MSHPVNVLLVEDDQPIAQTIQDGLDPAEFALRHARTLAESHRLLADQAFDIIILDLALPDGNGLDIADRLRSTESDVAILMLTGRDSVDARIDGFGHGADDYLCKPFAIGELRARLQALHRRGRGRQQHLMKYRDLEVDLLRRRLRRGDLEASLSMRELDVLVYLMRQPEIAVSKDRLLEDIWAGEAEEDSNVVNVYVNYLRNKTEGGRFPRLIQTVRNFGFMLSERNPEERAENTAAAQR